MSKQKNANDKYDANLKINYKTGYCSFEMKLDPMSYFYPWLLARPESEYHPDDGLTEEQSKKFTKASRERQEITLDKRYKELFTTKFQDNFESFLRHIQYEVEIEFRENITNLDYHLRENEDDIFRILKEKGLFFLKNRTILSKIQNWIDEGNREKLKKIAATFIEALKIKRGSPPQLVDRWGIVDMDSFVRFFVNRIRKKIKSDKRKDSIIADEIILKYKKHSDLWFKYLKKVVKENLGDEKGDLVKYLRNTPPREISQKVLALKYGVSERFIDETFRNRKKTMLDLQDLIENYRDIEIWSLDISHYPYSSI